MKKQIVIIHGGSTYDSYQQYLNALKKKTFEKDHLTQRKWRDTISKTLGHHYEVLTPIMPNSNNAKYLEWKIWFKKIEPFLKNGVVLVGHSLGGIFLAKYLEECKFPKKIMATFLIAAPFDDKKEKDSLADFSLSTNLSKFATQAGDIFLYHSKDDPVVSLYHVEKYKQALPHARVVVFYNRGHFSQESLPELVRDIKFLY